MHDHGRLRNTGFDKTFGINTINTPELPSVKGV